MVLGLSFEIMDIIFQVHKRFEIARLLGVVIVTSDDFNTRYYSVESGSFARLKSALKSLTL